MSLSHAMVRRATEDDLLCIHAIYEHYVLHSTTTYEETPPTWPQRLQWWAAHTEAYPVLVITAGLSPTAEVLGWAALSPFLARTGFRPTVENAIYLHPDHCHRGLGTLLLTALIQTAKNLDYTNLIALISSEQLASQRLHARCGFQRVGHLPHVAAKFNLPLSLDFWQLSLRTP
jgi:L-amino acid N-acyltransferase